MDVLLSIKPKYVEKIIKKEKKFEFRRTIFKQKINNIYIYSSFPVKKIVGRIFIKQILFLRIEKIWEETKEFSGMNKKDFFDYFKGKEKGYAIQIEKFENIEPINIKEVGKNFPPQSFFYFKFPLISPKN